MVIDNTSELSVLIRFIDLPINLLSIIQSIMDLLGYIPASSFILEHLIKEENTKLKSILMMVTAWDIENQPTEDQLEHLERQVQLLKDCVINPATKIILFSQTRFDVTWMSRLEDMNSHLLELSKSCDKIELKVCLWRKHTEKLKNMISLEDNQAKLDEQIKTIKEIISIKSLSELTPLQMKLAKQLNVEPPFGFDNTIDTCKQNQTKAFVDAVETTERAETTKRVDNQVKCRVKDEVEDDDNKTIVRSPSPKHLNWSHLAHIVSTKASHRLEEKEKMKSSIEKKKDLHKELKSSFDTILKWQFCEC